MIANMPDIYHLWSFPTRGTWIEINKGEGFRAVLEGRSPHGERGLKFVNRKQNAKAKSSFPTRGTWIEIVESVDDLASAIVVPHTGNVD